MRHNATNFENAFPVVAMAACTFMAGCTQVDAQNYDTSPPSIEQFQSAVAEQEISNREFVDQLEARLSSKEDQTAAPDLERQLTRSVEKNLSSTEATLREIRCRGNLCKVEINSVATTEKGTILAALLTAHTCAMPLIDFSQGATEDTILAYVDCDGP